ncbi:MAG: hypothetical protein SLRJCFUN_000065, partial [Candidatus Fervidibacter sp.]
MKAKAKLQQGGMFRMGAIGAYLAALAIAVG